MHTPTDTAPATRKLNPKIIFVVLLVSYPSWLLQAYLSTRLPATPDPVVYALSLFFVSCTFLCMWNGVIALSEADNGTIKQKTVFFFRNLPYFLGFALFCLWYFAILFGGVYDLSNYTPAILMVLVSVIAAFLLWGLYYGQESASH